MDIFELYKKDPSVNVSKLSGLHNPKWVKWRMDNPDADEDEKPHFVKGSALDCLLTNYEEFAHLYYVTGSKAPPLLMKKFVDNLPLNLDEDSDAELYREAYELSGYKASLQSIIDKLWKSPVNSDYYIDRKRSGGKIILPYDYYESVLYAKQAIYNTEYTRKYFEREGEHIEILYQVDLYFQRKDTPCKGLIDVLYINHKTKEIEVVDLKSIGKAIYNFRNSFLNYGYYLQAAQYRYGVLRFLEGEAKTNNLDLIKLADKIKDYKVSYMKFIVAEMNSKFTNPARVYSTTARDYSCGFQGGHSNGKFYPGIDQLLDDWNWHKDNDYWDLPRTIIENGGEEVLDLFN